MSGFDVVVVGAGPAGATAAYLAARRGLTVALVDKDQFPRDKPCGDGISPAAVRVAREVGLAHCFNGAVPISLIDIRGPDDVRLVGDLAKVEAHNASGYVIARRDFDYRLLQAAIAAGAHDFTGHKFIRTELCDGGRWLELRNSSGSFLRLGAKLLVGSDGAYSQVRSALGVQRAKLAYSGIAIRGYVHTSVFDPEGELGPRLHMDFGRETRPAYAWIFPSGQGTANIGIGISIWDMRRRRLNIRKLLDGYLALNRQRGIDLGVARNVRAHQLPPAPTMPRLVHPRAALIGDAASMINPVSGEGIGYAMSAAALLVAALPDQLSSPELQQHLAQFETNFRRCYRSHFISCLTAYLMLRSPFWTRTAITAASKSPIVMQDSLDLLFGVGRIRLATTAQILTAGWR